ncbi:50S ribosomal protein L33 [Candidatus Uhrbacteria bacterium]|nr:50S ribosomal protein L33 [Candidatus Uhrbacteria bacterium]
MSQENLIKLVSQGDNTGAGKGHVIFSRKNKKTLKERLELSKFNPLVRKHTVYKESK